MIRIFIGYDRREIVAYHTLAHSIIEHASVPVSITPLCLDHLAGIFARTRDPIQSTDFAFSRFLTPYLSGYAGWSLFMDCDMLMLEDVANLWALRDECYAVQVVKHDHKPPETTKFLGHKQTRYEKQNWSSVVLFNNPRCTALTLEYVNHATGLELHQFKWLAGDHLIGDLPPRWNVLVGYNRPADAPAVLHFTTGGPYFPEYRDTPYADEWFQYQARLNYAGKT